MNRSTGTIKEDLKVNKKRRRIYGWDKLEQASGESQKTSIADLEIDGVTVRAKEIVPYQSQLVDIIVGRSWLDRPRVIFIKKRRTPKNSKA